MIILTAGIDLSVGAAAILAQMVMAQTAADYGVPGVPGRLTQRHQKFGKDPAAARAGPSEATRPTPTSCGQARTAPTSSSRSSTNDAALAAQSP
jgi:ribose/xylose/arabinose/galactoside ABC-type transport system permease subunit